MPILQMKTEAPKVKGCPNQDLNKYLSTSALSRRYYVTFPVELELGFKFEEN